MIKMTLHRM